jgi:hypothetical protein
MEDLMKFLFILLYEVRERQGLTCVIDHYHLGGWKNLSKSNTTGNEK